MKNRALIEGLLCDHDTELSHLECDGFTRVAHYTLKTNGVQHRCFQGTVTIGDKTIPHWWIRSGKLTVDFRLRRWFPEAANVPHGVFDATKFPDVQYEGEEIQLNVPSVMYDILTRATA